MGVYGLFKYGEDYYGLTTLPTSVPWDVYDFCEPTDVTMLSFFGYTSVVGKRTVGAPHVWFNVDNDLCMMSDDGLDSGFYIEQAVTDDFTLQFTFLPTAIPDDFSDTSRWRFFVAAYNQFSKMVGLLFSENGGIALSRDGLTVDEYLLDSADLFDAGTTYYTVRVACDVSENVCHLYVTERDLVPYIGHQLRYTFSLYDTPGGYLDQVNVDVVGDASDPTQVCLDCFRLASSLVIPNQRPIAVPGPDKTRAEGQYASFDGSASYDPDPLDTIVQYWWTIASAPVGSDNFIQSSADTVSDASGYTNKLVGNVDNPTPFTDVEQGDLLTVGGNSSTVMYVAPDGSWVAAIDHVFPAGVSEIGFEVIKQSSWEGNWIPSSLAVVLDSGTDPTAFAPHSVGDAYLVLAGAVGDWLNKQHTIATWNGTSWDFTDPEDGDVLYDIAANQTWRYLYLTPAPPPHNGLWYEDEPKPWELGHWSGRADVIGKMVTSKYGLHVIELVVNDGDLDSLPAEVLLNVYLTDVALGLTPDLSFIFDYISDFWDVVEDRDKLESFWSSLTQLGASELLSLWQHDYSKGLFDIQRTFQRQWLDYTPLYEEPNYSELPATINNDMSVTGYSSSPNVQVEDPTDPSPTPALIDSTTAYDLGTTVSGITDEHFLVLEGRAYKIARVEQDTTTIVVTQKAMPTGTDRTGAWSIRPTVTSRSSELVKLGVQAGDFAVFEVIDGSDTEEYTGYVWAVAEKTISFDDSSISSFLADPDASVLFKGIYRRSAILVDDLVVSVPRLQEVIAIDRVEGAPAPLIEERDFRVLEVTTFLDHEVTWIQFLDAWFEEVQYGFNGTLGLSGSTSTLSTTEVDFESVFGVGADLSGYLLEVDGARYRLGSVLSSSEVSLEAQAWSSTTTGRPWSIRRIVDPPDTLWAEMSYLDNRPTIEDNFGRLVSFTLDDLEERTDNLDYLSAVRGLWYAYWFGPTPNNIRNGAQILLGLPFAEEAGTIYDIKSPYDSSRDRVLVQSDDNPNEFKAYYYPTILGIAVSRETGADLVVGDHVDQFDPLSKGINVDDWVSIEDWANTYIGSGDLANVQKVHSFLVKVSAEAFDLTNLLFMMSFVLRIKPKYTYPVFVVLKELYDTIDVVDSIAFGPRIPAQGEYPLEWQPFFAPSGWLPPAPNEENDADGAIVRTASPTYDIAQRWPNGRFYQVPIWPHYGNLHIFDTPGRTPSGWEGSWPSGHEYVGDQKQPLISSGARRYDQFDGSGRIVHRYDEHTAPYLEDLLDARDGHCDSTLLTYWTTVGSPTILQKDTSIKKFGTRSLEIQHLTAADQGASNVAGASDSDGTPSTHDEGYQVSVTGWCYLIDGSAVFRLTDQDGSTEIARVMHAGAKLVWRQFVLHAWVVSGSASPLTFEAVTGPAGGHFHIDGVEMFTKNVPWSQWGWDRHLSGRTGGYTEGGDPDEYLQVRLHVLAP